MLRIASRLQDDERAFRMANLINSTGDSEMQDNSTRIARAYSSREAKGCERGKGIKGHRGEVRHLHTSKAAPR